MLKADLRLFEGVFSFLTEIIEFLPLHIQTTSANVTITIRKHLFTLVKLSVYQWQNGSYCSVYPISENYVKILDIPLFR